MLSYSSISIIPGKFNKLFLTISDVNRSGRREVKIMDEIELKVHDMSSTLQPADAYALVLEEVNGTVSCLLLSVRWRRRLLRW